MKKIAVILSGCGQMDGSEIHEATLSLYALAKHGFEYSCFAPDIEQYHVINHLTGEVVQEKRNVLVESARIARGKIKSLHNYNAADFDGILLPGGYGAAKNLSSYAFEGIGLKVQAQVETAVFETYKACKPIVALCIAPVIVAKVLGANVTIGTDHATANHIMQIGGHNTPCRAVEIAYDNENKIITTPCYMEAKNIAEVGIGIENAIIKLKELMTD